MNIEIWKPIIYKLIKPGMYEISNMGNVRNIITGHIMSPCPSEKGYMMVSFRCIDYKTRCVKIHRIVASTFVDGENDINNEVNHIDGDKSNNTAMNLEWVSHIENMHHAYKHNMIKSMRGSHNGNSILCEFEVETICEYLVKYCGNCNMVFMTIKHNNVNSSIRLGDIHDIKYKKKWVWLSDKYFDIDSIKKIKYLTHNEIVTICKLLNKYNGDPFSVYCEMRDDTNTDIDENVISCINDGIYYRGISKKYLNKNFNSKKINDYRN